MKKMTSEKLLDAPEPRQRLPRLARAPKDTVPGLRLTQRDIATIAAVYEYRALTTPQIEALFFTPSTHTQCTHRLQLLYHHGFVLRGEQPQTLTEGRKPLVYWLDKQGAELIALHRECEVSDLDWKPKQQVVSYLYLAHLLATNTVRIAITKAAQQQGFVVEEWRDDKTLKREHAKEVVTLTGLQGGVEQAAVVPDGYFVLDTGPHRYKQFLEVDRRTVTGEASTIGAHDWARKVSIYLEYFRSGKYQARYGTMKGRILTVTTGEKRLENLKAITERIGGKSRFWFTTFEKATADAILTAPIWSVASRDELSSFTW